MKIALITGSRSDRNALVATGTALLDAGHDAKLVTYVSDYLRRDVVPAQVAAKALELTMFLGIGEQDGRFADLVLLHGDRYEIAAVALAVNIMGIPIGHIGGGDITEGSQDDCFRHAITKLSHMHFVSNQDAYFRVMQMGEEEDRIFHTGCPGIDMVMSTPTREREQTFMDAGLPEALRDGQRTMLVLFHPNTLGDFRDELETLSAVLAVRQEPCVLIGPNADSGASMIRERWRQLAGLRSAIVYHDNVEPDLFYSLLRHCDVLIGNSSAGYYEAPCFGIPVVDIGDRQKGRPKWPGIMNCHLDPRIIANTLDTAVGYAHCQTSSPYGDGKAAERITTVISKMVPPQTLLRKRFNNRYLDGI